MFHDLVRWWRQWRRERLRLAIIRWEQRGPKDGQEFNSLREAVTACYVKGFCDHRAAQLRRRLAQFGE